MAFRPMLPGILSSSGGATGFSITAGTAGAAEGYASSTFATDLGATSFGSATGDSTADGGTIEGVYWQDETHILAIKNGSASASNISIDSTDYTLTFESTVLGYDIYAFSSGTQVIFDGNTYEITVT